MLISGTLAVESDQNCHAKISKLTTSMCAFEVEPNCYASTKTVFAFYSE